MELITSERAFPLAQVRRQNVLRESFDIKSSVEPTK